MKYTVYQACGWTVGVTETAVSCQPAPIGQAARMTLKMTRERVILAKGKTKKAINWIAVQETIIAENNIPTY